MAPIPPKSSEETADKNQNAGQNRDAENLLINSRVNVKNFVGNLEPYMHGENFEDYLDRMENYFELNEVEQDKFKILLLNNLIGPDASVKLTKACKPRKPKEYSYEEIVQKCKELFAPQTKTCTNPVIFRKRIQQKGESVNDFAVELISLAEGCDFGAYRDKALRTQFISGIYKRRIKAELMAMDDSTKFKQIVQKAVAIELIDRDLDMLDNRSDNVKVNQIQSNFVDSNKRRYYRGRSKSRNRNYRNRSMSRGRKIKCFNCEGLGHIAKQCSSPKTTSSTGKYRNKNYANYKNQNDGSSNSRQQYNNYSKSSNRNDGVCSTNQVDSNFNFGNLSLKDYGELNNISMDTENSNQCVNTVNHINKLRVSEIEFIYLIVEGQKIGFEIDTGACVSLCSVVDYEKHFNHLPIVRIDLPLSVLTGNKVELLGKIEVEVSVERKNITYNLNLIVINTQKHIYPICGRDWLDILQPEWRNSFQVNQISGCNEFRIKMLPHIKREYASVFDGDLSGCIRDFEVNIQLVDEPIPIFHKPYTLPFSVREKVEKELDDMIQKDIITPVTTSDWASPIVVVPKPDNEIRICIDCSVTVNNYVRSQHYPLPIIDEVLASLAGNNYFVSIDLKGAYTQLKLSENSQKLVTINTHRGLFRYKRLPFGLKPAASIFQSVMDQILLGIPGAFCYIDDILIGGKNLNELYERSCLVLKQLRINNIKANWDKCNFFVEKLRYLGHEISAKGIGPCQKKLKAVVEAPVPSNVSELKSFIGLLNYYSKFLPRLNENCSVLYKLLCKDSQWKWDQECQKVFDDCKQALVNSAILEHFDPKKPIVVVCDASDRGISGILCHIVDGIEKPVFFISRTISKAERNYPILHREALAVVFSLEKFYKYIFGHHVVVYSDHKPLKSILSKKKCQSSVIATRLQRYIYRLSIFDFDIRYRKGSENGNADFLSRLPIEGNASEDDINEERLFQIHQVENNDSIQIDIASIGKETIKDKVLVKLMDYISNGWNESNIPRDYKNYFLKNEFLSIEKGCVLYRGRLVIPKSMQKDVLSLLHINHCGMVKMKTLARIYVFWEGIDRDIEQFVKKCHSCQVTQSNKHNKVFINWPDVQHPFERVHIDFFHFDGKEFLILIDVYSRWLEVVLMRGTNANKVIEELDGIFRTFGFPVELVSDNGPPFNSFLFGEFCKNKSIKLTHTPPYHPSSNGQVERAVQTTKNILKKYVLDFKKSGQSIDLNKAVKQLLRNYNNLPCTEENIIPSHRMFSFKPRTNLDLLKIKNEKKIAIELPEESNKDSNKKVRFCNVYNKYKAYVSQDKVKIDQFKRGEVVLYFDSRNQEDYITWVKAKILERKSTVIYSILVNNRTKIAHVNQLRKSILKNHYDDENDFISITSGQEDFENESNFCDGQYETSHDKELNEALRKSNRVRRPPEKFKDYNMSTLY